MNLVPTEGPEVDLCRVCQMIWFDAGELAVVPKRSRKDIDADKWNDELREMRKRREHREFFDRMMLRRIH